MAPGFASRRFGCTRKETPSARRGWVTHTALSQVLTSTLSVQAFYKNVAIRKHVRHRNIVPFLGATLDPPQLLSAWMPGGGLVEYVTANPEKNRLRLVGSLPAVSGEVLTLLASCAMSLRVWNICTAKV